MSNRKEKQQGLSNRYVWSDGGWTKITRVIRHKCNKRIFRINVHCGIVDVTEDHSLLQENGAIVKPTEVNIGDVLLTKRFGSFSTNNTNVTISKSKSKIELAWMCYIIQMAGLGYSISIESDNCYVIQTQCSKSDGKIINLFDLGETDDFVYDIETEYGHFCAGIGNIILKNTDSIFCKFNRKLSPTEIWEESAKIVYHMHTIFPPPMSLEFEDKIHKKFLLLTKKRYIEQLMDKNGVMAKEIISKGTLLVKRDFCSIVKIIYKGFVELFFQQADIKTALDYISEQFRRMFRREFPTSDFVITKSLSKNLSDYKNEPAHAILAERMIRRQQEVVVGSRLQYVFTTNGYITDNQSMKIEDYNYFIRHGDLLRLDYLYYLKSQFNQLEDTFYTCYGGSGKVIEQEFKLHKNKHNVNEKIKTMFNPTIIYESM